MSKLVEYAQRELEYAFPDKDDKLQQLAIKNVLELLEIFSEQGHTGISAPYVLGLFNRVAHWKPIKPLTGDDDEWGEAHGENNIQQNKRYSSVFRKNYDNSTAYNSEGKVFIDKDGFCYTNCDSYVGITFPYEVPNEPEYVKEIEK